MREYPGGAGSPVLFITGGGDSGDQLAVAGKKLFLYGSTDLHKLVRERERYHRLHITPNYLRQAKRPELTAYACIVNLITEPETNSKILEIARKLLRDIPGRVVNPPDRVLQARRDQIARKLEGIDGLVVPATVRIAAGKAAIAARAIEKAGMTLPVILRTTGSHGGKIVGRFDAVESLVAAIGPGGHVATQFVDFASGDGLYRKYRIFFIGEGTILRHCLISDHWNVHAKDRTRFMAPRPEMVAEERGLFERAASLPPRAMRVLEEVRRRIALDFFGIDFGILPDGRLLLFEANATMNFFPFAEDPAFAYLCNCLEPAERAFRELLGLPAPEQGGGALAAP